MTLISRLITAIEKLPPAETHDIEVERNIQIPMHDGVLLMADHYNPSKFGLRPTMLILSPYHGRTENQFLNQLYAEHGFQVLVISSRGTEGSGGVLNPFRQEREDAIDIVKWLSKQEWFNGEIICSGPSYNGFTAYAFAVAAGSMLKAISVQLTSADFRSMIYPGDAFALETFIIGWLSTINIQGSYIKYINNLVNGKRKRGKKLSHLPLGELDKIAFNKTYSFWQEWLDHESPEDLWWSPVDLQNDITQITAPIHMLSGWYDFMLPSLVRDYNTLIRAGKQPYLTIGPWTHISGASAELRFQEEIIWLRQHALNGNNLREQPVHIYVMGANEWRDLQSFPPESMHPQRWYLHPDGILSSTVPPNSEPDHYNYDPNDPTPSVGGAGRFSGIGPARQDNRKLESRSDVLTYTTKELSTDLEIIGPVEAELFIQSSQYYTDFFVRITDVEPSGKSMNVCDGLQRLTLNPQTDECQKVTVKLSPIAHRFQSGHRIRIQVSSGSFPRWNRNLGTGEPLTTAKTMKVGKQTIYHDPNHPSAIILPVYD